VVACFRRGRESQQECSTSSDRAPRRAALTDGSGRFADSEHRRDHDSNIGSGCILERRTEWSRAETSAMRCGDVTTRAQFASSSAPNLNPSTRRCCSVRSRRTIAGGSWTSSRYLAAIAGDRRIKSTPRRSGQILRRRSRYEQALGARTIQAQLLRHVQDPRHKRFWSGNFADGTTSFGARCGRTR